MNKGIYLDEDLKRWHLQFCIGVAGYPKNIFKRPICSDLKFLKAKIDAGAEYIVTQMFLTTSILSL